MVCPLTPRNPHHQADRIPGSRTSSNIILRKYHGARFQGPQYWLGFAEGIRLACLVEYRLKQQIATLEEELARSKQENMDQKEELQKLNQKLHLQEPLLNVGVKICRRFLEKAKMKRGLGNAVESIVEAGNAAAHRGNIFADSALFTLGILRSTDSISPGGGSTEIEDNYRSLGRDLYGVNIIHSLPSSFSTKAAEIYNLSATITSCSTMKPGGYSGTDVRHRRFNELAAKCAKLDTVMGRRIIRPIRIKAEVFRCI
ncbi:hypothetical protein NA56DRAFT_700833 [Hyaloscypha hepaticicola]|uniref:Uncharacterized protein n=1 Tax=Hyaloscypha hepaticicola TaxID=2082293 RepID=A0A2J6QDL0_9HELO|nr:hypothetical protein NA56DRAFT_700833 [Hyaloscypha hepaticicola]